MTNRKANGILISAMIIITLAFGIVHYQKAKFSDVLSTETSISGNNSRVSSEKKLAATEKKVKVDEGNQKTPRKKDVQQKTNQQLLPTAEEKRFTSDGRNIPVNKKGIPYYDVEWLYVAYVIENEVGCSPENWGLTEEEFDFLQQLVAATIINRCKTNNQLFPENTILETITKENQYLDLETLQSRTLQSDRTKENAWIVLNGLTDIPEDVFWESPEYNLDPAWAGTIQYSFYIPWDGHTFCVAAP